MFKTSLALALATLVFSSVAGAQTTNTALVTSNQTDPDLNDNNSVARFFNSVPNAINDTVEDGDNVLSNDSDPDGDSISVVSDTCTATISSAGVVSGVSAAETCTYTVTDGTGQDIATVVVDFASAPITPFSTPTLGVFTFETAVFLSACPTPATCP